jgi:hypothetical protein
MFGRPPASRGKAGFPPLTQHAGRLAQPSTQGERETVQDCVFSALVVCAGTVIL